MRMTGARFAALLKDGEWLARYQQWLADPMTQDMLALADRAGRPAGLERVTGEYALYQSGITLGSQVTLDFMSSIPALAERQAGGAELEADFGVDAMMKQLGYTPDQIKKAKSEEQ